MGPASRTSTRACCGIVRVLALAALAMGCSFTAELDELSGGTRDQRTDAGTDARPDGSGGGQGGWAGESAGGSAGMTAGFGGQAGGAGSDASAGSGGSGNTGGTGCGPDTLCVPAPPLGWQGPVALWTGDVGEPSPDCATVGLSPALTAYAGASWAAAECETCSCAGFQGGSCAFSLDLFAAFGSCLAKVGGGEVSSGCALLSTNSSAGAKLTATTPSGGSCAPSGGNVLSLPLPTTGRMARACEGLATGGSCGGSICVYAPPAPFDSAPCIYRSGQASCPADYPVSSSYASVDDQRGCGTCSCQATATTCTGSISLSSSTTCGTSTVSLGAQGVCKTFTAMSPVYAMANNVSVSGTCVAQGGDATGSVVESDVTICCRQ